MKPKGFDNKVMHQSYVVYARNPEPTEPQRLFFDTSLRNDEIAIVDYEHATHCSNLYTAVSEYLSIKDRYVHLDLEICRAQTVLDSVDPSNYRMELINNTRERILSKLTEEERQFLSYNGLYPEDDCTNAEG
jgi:hypothetical protein